MARTPDPHSASAQFFINVKDNDFLNFSAPTANGWGYAVFGKVTDGFDVVDAIAKVKTGNRGPRRRRASGTRRDHQGRSGGRITSARERGFLEERRSGLVRIGKNTDRFLAGPFV